MEREARYAMVGLSSILLCLGLAGFLIWLAGAQLSHQFDTYIIAFTGPVRGLSTGGEVFFNGIRVGEVTKLSIDRNDTNRVEARIRVDADAPIHTDSRAGLEPQGVTGVNYIQISAGTAKASLLKDVTPLGRIPVILATPSPLESLLQGGGDVLTRTVEVLDRTKKLMSDENIAGISGAISDIHAITGSVRDQRRLMADADASARSLDLAASRIAVLAANTDHLVEGPGKAAIANLADASLQMKLAAKDAQGLIAALKGPAADFAARGLPQIEISAAHLQIAADSITRLSDQIQLSPSAFLAKPPAQTLKVKP
jgi:phospholipid/cholesterol/gamma-HCH transport system substrate-binding protein